MKKKLFYIFLLVLSLTGKAQNISHVISSAGGYDKNQSLSLDWVLGESFIETVTSNDQMLTQGFLQPLIVKKLPMNLLATVSFNSIVAPNPFLSQLNLKILTPVHQKLALMLYDSKGQVLITRSIHPDQIAETFDLSNYANGTYILQVKNGTGKILSSFMVNKIR